LVPAWLSVNSQQAREQLGKQDVGGAERGSTWVILAQSVKVRSKGGTEILEKSQKEMGKRSVQKNRGLRNTYEVFKGGVPAQEIGKKVLKK